MPYALEDHAPRVRCHSCGSPDIHSLCHHCAKPMCRKHSPAAFDESSKPLSREFADLELGPAHEGVYHCDEHDHVVKGRMTGLIWSAAGVAVVGVIVLFLELLPGLVLLLAGVALAGVAYRGDRIRNEAARAVRPPLPLVPQLDTVSVVETLRGQVRLGDEGYTSTAGRVNGQIDLGMTLAKAGRDRLAIYQNKYRLPDGEPVEFSAGFAVIEGEAGLTFVPAAGDVILPDCATMRFRGNPVGHPLFSSVPGRPEGEWKFGLRYDVMSARAPESIPLWIVPSLVPASDQRTLEIDLHWELLGEEGREFGLERFDLIELKVPPDWGNVESTSPSDALTSRPAPGQARSIQWKQLPPRGDKDNTDRMSRTLTVRFEHQIMDQPFLEGSLRATFNGTLSGLTGIGFYLPGGGLLRPPPELKSKTEVSVDFSISLGSVRYQDDRVVPDQGNVDDIRRSEVDEFKAVIPDYHTVIELTNAISKEGYYVKRVIEHPPGGGKRAGVVNRVWDIAGRWYEGVFPIDFHMTLTGEEEYQGNIKANAGNTIARISVQGAYANPKMKGQIEGKWDELHRIVTKMLRDRAPDIPEVIESPAAAKPEPAESFSAEDPSDRVPRPDRPDAARIAELLKMKDDARRALLDGRISENMYRDLIVEIDAELNGYGGNL